MAQQFTSVDAFTKEINCLPRLFQAKTLLMVSHKLWNFVNDLNFNFNPPKSFLQLA